MYDIRPNLVIGCHGYHKSIADKLIANQAVIEKSKKPYYWLGHGMYFRENNLERTKLWAKDKERRGEIKEASVVVLFFVYRSYFDPKIQSLKDLNL